MSPKPNEFNCLCRFASVWKSTEIVLKFTSFGVELGVGVGGGTLGVIDGVGVLVGVTDGVCVLVGVTDGVCVLVGVTDGVCVLVGVGVGVTSGASYLCIR
jgi:hypothetical protein